VVGQCQPLGGIHIHQPQFHIIGTMQPGAHGTSWPGGVNDANVSAHSNTPAPPQPRADGWADAAVRALAGAGGV